MSRGILRGVLGTLILGLVLLLGLMASSATSADAEIGVSNGTDCDAGDARAACETGNDGGGGNATCTQLFGAAPAGKTVFSLGGGDNGSDASDANVSVTNDGTYLTITINNSLVTILGSSVKATNAFNVYTGAILTALHAPISGNSGTPAGISHWTVCYYLEDETTTTPPNEEPTTTVPETTTTVEETTTTVEETTTTVVETTTSVPELTTTTVEETTTTPVETTTTCDPYICSPSTTEWPQP